MRKERGGRRVKTGGERKEQGIEGRDEETIKDKLIIHQLKNAQESRKGVSVNTYYIYFKTINEGYDISSISVSMMGW